MHDGENLYEYIDTNQQSRNMCLLIDSQGNKWMGKFEDGLIKYDGKFWKKYNMGNYPLLSNFVTSLAIDSSKNLWVGGSYSFAVFDGSQWIIPEDPELAAPWYSINAIEIDKNQNVWLADDRGPLLKYNGTNWEIFYSQNSDLPNASIYDITCDNKCNIWIGTRKGLVKYDGNDWTILKKGHITNLEVDA